MVRASLAIPFALLCAAHGAHAQSHDHMQMTNAPAISQAGEAAYGAIAEVVRILAADPNTDWSKVNLERLRVHLADMHEVTVNASIRQSPVPGGLLAEVTGSGRTIGAIQRMARAHGRAAGESTPYSAEVTELENGARIQLVARGGAEKDVQKLRGLGFIGWLTLDDHHAPHHLMMARGTANAAH